MPSRGGRARARMEKSLFASFRSISVSRIRTSDRVQSRLADLQMKTTSILFLAGLAASVAFAQQPEPKKNPFTGFGNTGLDRRKPAALSPSPAGPRPVMPGPSAPTVPAAANPNGGTAGIALSEDWTGRLTQGSGGQTMKMKDLQALLAGFGSSERDIAAHPDVTIYDGQRMDGAPGDNCRVTYLMPLDRAEAALMRNRGISTVARAVAPGFPDGLFLHTYDVKAGIYNRLCLVTDNAKPQQQVVSLVLKSESSNWYPPAPFRKLERDWHVFDYVGTENRGQPGITIDTRVNDVRGAGHFIVVNTTGGYRPELVLPPPGILIKPARFSPKETTTWHVPEPLIKLILHCLSKQLGS